MSRRRSPVVVPRGYESLPFEHETSVGVLARRVLRRPGPGPAVILIHEAPGLSATTFGIADRLAERGFTVVLPELLDAPGSMISTGIRLCIARELGALTRGQPGAIVDWLRGLCERESAASGFPSVGVIGMCFSGGFALATAVDSRVRAVVSSQPALPFGLSDLGLSPRDLGLVRDNVRNGTCIRALRYRLDWKSPGPRLRRLRREIPTADVVVLPTWDPRRHSVLAAGLSAASGTPLAAALTGTVAFLEAALEWSPPSAPSA